MQVPNLYQILGISRKMADGGDDQFLEKLRDAYLEKAAPYHQIVTSAQSTTDDHAVAMFEVLTDAYDILQDSDQRAEYHQYLQGTKVIDLIPQRTSAESSMNHHSPSTIADSFAEMADIERQIGSIVGFE